MAGEYKNLIAQLKYRLEEATPRQKVIDLKVTLGYARALLREMEAMAQQLETLQTMNAVTVERREWFTIPGPSFQDDENYRALFTLHRNGSHQICDLGRGDLLFVGRAQSVSDS